MLIQVILPEGAEIIDVNSKRVLFRTPKLKMFNAMYVCSVKGGGLKDFENNDTEDSIGVFVDESGNFSVESGAMQSGRE